MQTRTSSLKFQEDHQGGLTTHTCRLIQRLMTILHRKQVDCLCINSSMHLYAILHYLRACCSTRATYQTCQRAAFSRNIWHKSCYMSRHLHSVMYEFSFEQVCAFNMISGLDPKLGTACLNHSRYCSTGPDILIRNAKPQQTVEPSTYCTQQWKRHASVVPCRYCCSPQNLVYT